MEIYTQKHINTQTAWYPARTRYGQELGVKSKLESLGIEHFIPTEKKKNYRGQLKEHPVIHNMVFIKTTKQHACDLRVLDNLPLNYMFDYAKHTMMTIPEKQMEDFIRVFQASLTTGGLIDQPVSLGDRVRVIKGSLKGVEGNVLELQGKYYVVVGLCGIVFAKAKIPLAWLEKVYTR